MIGRKIQNEQGMPGVLIVLNRSEYGRLGEPGVVELSLPYSEYGFIAVGVAEDDEAALARADELAPMPADPEVLQ